MSLKYVQHIRTPKSLTVVAKEGSGKDRKDKIFTFDCTSNEYAEGLTYIRNHKFAKLVELITGKKPPAGVKVSGDVAWFNDEKLPPALAAKVRQFIDTKTNIKPLKAFWEHCKRNPSEHSKNQLFGFVDKWGVTLLPDGQMLLYKGIREDFTSHHDGKTLHKIGTTVKVNRSSCASTPGSACGYGLHCAPFDHVSRIYGSGKIVEVIVNPANVTSVPDHDGKMRCCEYYVNCLARKDGFGVKEGLVTDHKPTKKNAPKNPVSKKWFHIPWLDSITIVGALMSKAGFVPGQGVKVWLGKDRVIIAPSRATDETIVKRYKVTEGVEATTHKPSGSLRIRALVIGKHLGVDQNGEFKATVLENNAVALYKA